jgi:hypothetical protein
MTMDDYMVGIVGVVAGRVSMTMASTVRRLEKEMTSKKSSEPKPLLTKEFEIPSIDKAE